MGVPDDSVGFRDDARQVLARFAERVRLALISDGWEVGPDGPATGDSIFLGSFQQPVVSDLVATVQFILETGPAIHRVELHLTQGVVPTGGVHAAVGGELGIRHLPTERLLAELQVPCEADISRDLAEIFEDQGEELPSFTDETSADLAARVLVDAVAVHALPFARAHADVDRIVKFVRDGGQTTRDEIFEYIFVPTLLAASGRTADARAALGQYRKRLRPGSDEEAEYFQFLERLESWLP